MGKKEKIKKVEGKHTLRIIKRIRIIPRRMSPPHLILIRPIQHRISHSNGHRHRGVVDEIPQRRVAQPLLALHPLLGLVSDPGGNGREERVDAAGGPFLEEAFLEGPFC